MLKELGKLFCLSSSIFLIASCNNGYKGDFTVIEADKEPNYNLCYISIDTQALNINSIRVYVDGKLSKYKGCNSEGFYTEDFNKGNTYSVEDESVKDISISKVKNEVVYFGKSFNIITEKNDSLLIRVNKSRYLILVGKIPK